MYMQPPSLYVRISGDRLREARISADLTQAQVAETAGVTQTYISLIEVSGERPVKRLKADAIARACQVTRADLLAPAVAA